MDYTLLGIAKDIFPYKSIEEFTQSGTLEVLVAGATVVGLALTARSWLSGIREYDEEIDEMTGVNRGPTTQRVLSLEEQDEVNRARTYVDITTRQI